MREINFNVYTARGFTALELIIVLTIFAIITAIAVPQYSTWRTSAASRQVTWEIKHKMRFARERAITTNRQTQFEIQIVNGRYRLMQGNLSAGSTAWTEIAPWTDINEETSLNTGAGCADSTNVNIGFNPNGSADASTFICVNDSTGANRFTMLVNRTNGSIRIR